MKTAALILAVVALLLFALEASAKRPVPAVVIECALGGIVKHDALLANAANCVGRDKYGGHFWADSLAVFRDYGDKP